MSPLFRAAAMKTATPHAARAAESRFWMTRARAVVGATVAAAEDWPHAVAGASRWSVRETARRIEESAQRQGLVVFARIEQAQPGIEQPGRLVIVIESSQGGTPVVMRGEGGDGQADVPLSLVVRPAQGGASEVLIASGRDYADGWRALPGEIVADLAALPALVADALQ
jgi:uncharacterized protein (DUF302 family)